MAAAATQQQQQQQQPQQQQLQHHHAAPPTGLARWTPSLPTTFINMLNPFAGESSHNNGGASNTESASWTPRRSLLGGVRFNDTVQSGPPSPTASSARSTMFAEPDTHSTSEADSREGSIIALNQHAKRNVRTKTRYSVCHPPPASMTRAKLHRRPRSLLQLHKLCSSSRPTPAFDVIPSANFSVRLTRTVAKVFKARHGLCPNDLLVLHAEKYASEDEEEQEQEQEARDIVGLICKSRKEDNAMGKAKICVADGKEWDACALPNGGYEFNTTDVHGLALTVRWVLKRTKDRDGNPTRPADKHRRFNFSTISPNSRRHPVIATLSRSGLDINDSYKMPTATAPNTPNATPNQTTSILAETLDGETGQIDPSMCETDPELKQLVTLTSIWVTFKEGWSPTFRYDDKEKDRDASLRASSINNSPIKSTDTPPMSPAQLAVERSGSIRSLSVGLMRKGSLRRSKRASIVSSVASVDEDSQNVPSRSSSVDHKTSRGRARADSNSTVLVHPVPVNRRRSKHQATWRPDLIASTSPLREVSRENSTDPRTSHLVTRTSWQAYPGEATTPRKESTVSNGRDASHAADPGAAVTLAADHSDPDDKSQSTAAGTDVASDGLADGAGSTQAASASSIPKLPRLKARDPKDKRRSTGGWRKLWCGT